MTHAFTRGPWSVFPHYCKDDSESIYAQTWLIGLGQFDTIAEVRPGHDQFDSQNDANARLISAAPELLEAASDTLEALQNLRLGIGAGIRDQASELALIDAHIDELQFAILKATTAGEGVE